MRNVIAIALCLVASFSINQAGAMPLAHPGALKDSIQDTGLIEQVHCVPGWYHHDYGNWDGCGGAYYSGGYYPGVYRGGYYRGGYYRGAYRRGVYRGYRGAHVAHHGRGYRGGYRGGARVSHHGGARVGGRGGGRRSDIRLKHDIMPLGHLQNGIPFYRFAYIGSDVSYVGVMAQDVQKVDPRAVTSGADGYLRVHYERLGLKFQTYNEWMIGGGTVPAGRMH